MTRHKHRGSTDRSTTYHRDQSGYLAVPSTVASDGCLSSRADFIPSWLNHMQNNPPRDIPQPKSPLDSNNLSWHPNGLTTVCIQPNYGTRRYESSDIFIQNTPSQSPVPDQGFRYQYRQPAPDSDNGQNLHDGERHRHAMRAASPTSENSLTKYQVFEKQPRRKTRRDRYDTIKSKVGRMEKGNRKKTSTRVSKKERLRSSREVMANFRSQAIANPGDKITLEQKFTPGLFVNGRSSAPLADLAFNDIPLNLEMVDTREKEHPSKTESKQRKKRSPRLDEIESFADALKRLIADYPPSESASRPNSTVVSNVIHTRRSDGGNNERPLQRDSRTPRSRTPRSLSIRSHPTVVNSSRNLTQKTQGRRTIEPELTAARNREDHTPNGHDIAGFPNYQDKGVMVSPWIHQQARENLSYAMTSNDHQLRRERAESPRGDIHMPNTVFEIPTPEIREEVAEELDFEARRIEDLTYPRDTMSPMLYGDSTSGRYPSHALYPHQEASQAAKVSHGISQIVDDIPGETLKEYIDRMEREILGPDKPSAHYIDKALLPTEAGILDHTMQPSKPLCEIGYRNRFPQRGQRHESVDLFPKSYPRFSYPEESTNESEPAFVWQPNHMMWC